MNRKLLWLILGVSWPTSLMVAQSSPSVDSRTAFEIHDGGKLRRFDLALDELAEKPSSGRERSAKSTAVTNLGDLRKKARAAEAATGAKQDIVLYEQGRPRDEASRRVVSRKVLATVAAGFDAAAAGAAIKALAVEKPSYAPGTVIFTVAGPGDALAVLEALRAVPGVLSAEPLLAKQQRRRLIPNDTFFAYNASNPGYQWHLRNTGQTPGTTGVDVNVTSVWDSYTGLGVRMGIVDDGLEVAHPDLAPNADTVNDHDWNDSTPNDPTGSGTHGTGCAGVAGAR
ncbi:MAG: S8 family serine peptidase, partial [Roseimicrobium sp.]